MSNRSSTPAGVDLAQLRTQAKELLRAIRSQSPEALARFRAQHPRSHALPIEAVKLADALLILAREHGFPSWPKLAAAAQAARLDFDAKTDAFLIAAVTGRMDRARSLLEETPAISKASIHTAAAFGDTEALRDFLAADPSLAAAAGGPRRRPPLLYAAFSHYLKDADRRERIVAGVRLLLRASADPNAAFREEPWPENPLTALYGAAGHFHDAELAEILLDAGADPNDNESLYHSVEQQREDNKCTALLLSRGADPNAGNAIFHQLDYEDPEGLRLFLKHGANPNQKSPTGGTALHWAIARARSVDCVALLLGAGADAEALDPHGLTPYRLAVRTGQTETAELLSARGGETGLTLEDRVLCALAAGDATEIERLRRADPDGAARAIAASGLLLSQAAAAGRADSARLILEAGAPVDARGELNATPLHWAAWNAHADVMRLLIAWGAPLEVRGSDHGETPLQWALHGSGHNPDRPREAYVEAIEILVGAGAQIESAWLEAASEKIRSVFISFS